MDKENNDYDYLSIVAKLPKGDKIVLAKSFGTPLLQSTTNVLVSFFKTIPKTDESKLMSWNEEIASKFIVASMYCYLHKNDEFKKGEIKFEQILRTIYNSPSLSQSGRDRITRLLSTPFTSGGGFEKKLVSIIKANKDAFKSVDLNALQKDIRYWNCKGMNSSKNKWARKIVAYEEKLNTNIGEKE